MTKKQNSHEKENGKKIVGSDLVFGMEMWKIKALFPVLGVVLVIIVSFGILVLPKISQISDFGKKKADLEVKTTDVKQKINYLNSADESIIKSREDILLAALPESKDIHYVLNVISVISREYGFPVVSFSLSPGEVTSGEEEKEVEKMPFSLVLVGPSDKYVELIDGIENMLPILAITDLDSRSVSSNLLEIKLSLVTNFFLSETKVDMKKLTYKELVITDKELELMDKLSGFKKSEQSEIMTNGTGTSDYVEFPVSNPFKSVD